MLFPESHVKIWLYREATDMRKSFNGLMNLVKHHMQSNPLSGELFVFINRRQTQIKILYFDRSGYCIWMKRLEEGRFEIPAMGHQKMALDWTKLKCILDGIDLKSIRQRKRYDYCHKEPS